MLVLAMLLILAKLMLALLEGENLTRMGNIVQTTRIGISQAKDIPWRWYLKSSRSVSKRVRGDRIPPKNKCWEPSTFEGL